MSVLTFIKMDYLAATIIDAHQTAEHLTTKRLIRLNVR